MKNLFLFSMLALALSGCESQTIQGRLVDPCGQPIEGATVSVDKTMFSTTTDSNGEYQLDYAPGVSLVVRWDKEDDQRAYEPVEVKLSITEKCAYPLPEQTMWCCPKTDTPQLYLLGETDFEELTLMPMEQIKTWNYTKVSRGSRYVVPGVSWVSWHRFRGEEDNVGALAVKQYTRPTRGGKDRLDLKLIYSGEDFNAFVLKEDKSIVAGDTIIMVINAPGTNGLFYGLQIID